MRHVLLFLAAALVVTADLKAAGDEINLLEQLASPVVLEGDNTTAYRDPAALYHDGTFYLFYTFVKTEKDGKIYLYTAMSKSSDLKTWSQPKKITPKGQKLNFSSPGNVIRYQNEWILCLQSYPIPGLKRSDSLRWANNNARVFIMRSKDLQTWSDPELLRVKGSDVPREDMGRCIDAYLVEDVREAGKWWCFYKQDGASYSWSRDLRTWQYKGQVDSGENVCVLTENDEYIMFHSPANGIGIKRSKDLEHWQDWGQRITLGQDNWPWAETRLTAGFVMDLRDVPKIGKYVMFFHGVGPGKKRTLDNAFANCNIGIAWSEDLQHWDWPGKGSD